MASVGRDGDGSGGGTGGSVTVWIGRLADDQRTALAALHRKLWPRLVALARRNLRGAPATVGDEEDIAQEAFWGFCRSLRDGRVPRLADRHDLLALLTHITACKAAGWLDRHFGTQKRGAGRTVIPLDAQGGGSGSESGYAIDPAGAEPTPEQNAILADAYGHFVEGLPEELREFARLYLAGLTHREIAAACGVGLRTAERKVALTLTRWREMAAESLTDGRGPTP
jgi:DNA-directed RNA polymerase specialized sigma24 family protein